MLYDQQYGRKKMFPKSVPANAVDIFASNVVKINTKHCRGLKHDITSYSPHVLALSKAA
jgi:hypothetical protein